MWLSSARLNCRLLSTLRAKGLDSIGSQRSRPAPSLESLMGLHQQAFQALHKKSLSLSWPHSVAARKRGDASISQDDPWSPQEAHLHLSWNSLQRRRTCFPSASRGNGTYADAVMPDATDAATNDSVPARRSDMPWALNELLVDGQWVRTQLTWASPYKTPFLLTTGAGTTQSMTRRSRDRFLAAGQLRVVSDRLVVDRALERRAEGHATASILPSDSAIAGALV